MKINTRFTMNRILYLILLSCSLFVIFLLIKVASNSVLFTIPMAVLIIISFNITFVYLFLRINKENTITVATKTYVLFSLLLSASLFVIFLVTPEVMDNYYRYRYIPMFITVGITIAIAFVYLYLYNKDVIEAIVDEDKEDPFDIESGMPTKFTFNFLKVATANFNEKLGRGGFGSVFKGKFGKPNTRIRKIAVKRIGSQGKKEFLAEVKTVGSLHHVNLVRLIGFCAENSHKLLVYERMCNGSLDRWIFHHNPESSLDWPTRRKIILHIAQGLSYLHRDCHRTIIHFNIKPQNILLDENFTAKIADIGLARFIETGQRHVSTVLNWTPGYWAPEWWLKKKITEKVDVYSFGVVVLEIIAGRQNVDHSLPEGKDSLLHLVKKKAEEDRLFDLVDKQSDDMVLHKEEVVWIIKTAIWCLQTDSTKRPSMSVVVNILKGLMDMETINNISDYSFLTWTPMEPPRQSDTSCSNTLLPVTLSGPR